MSLRLLRIPDECLNKVHVLLQDVARHTLSLQVDQESLPRGVHIRGREPLLGIVTHVRDVLERTSSGA